MAFDSEVSGGRKTVSLRDAVLDLMARRDGGNSLTEYEYRDELRALVATLREPAEDLWDKYHSPSPTARARAYMKYGY